jgi:acyl carrier protein
MSDIKQTVRQFIIDNFLMGQGGERIRDDNSLLDAGALDSTGVIELVAFLESTFGIKVRDEDMVPENLDSLANLERYVLMRRKAAA